MHFSSFKKLRFKRSLVAIFASVFAPASFGSALVYKDTVTRTMEVHARIVFDIQKGIEDIGDGIIEEINRMWNASRTRIWVDGEWYRVFFDVRRSEMGRPSFPYSCAYNFYRIQNPVANVTESEVPRVGGQHGVLLTSDRLGESTTAAHEFGHSLGLRHPGLDQRAAKIPGIMLPRGSLVKPKFQYNEKVRAGRRNGTLDPKHRVVRPEDIGQLRLSKLPFNQDGMACLGEGYVIAP